ncbi:MAG: ribosome small subunit-dependent GTPase A [Oscillospiraceae bacterium]|nr:ribosome small subunit-dependent GTPase A [Oscillospiraceae bacterium]
MNEKTALVTAVHKERYELLCGGEQIYGKLKTAVYFNNGTELYPTTGDFVTVQYNPIGDSVIIRTRPRKSLFSRQDPDKTRPREQAVAANFDYVFIMASLNQDFSPRRIERYLTLAWQSGATPVIVLTKADLADDIPSAVRETENAAAGVEIHAVSAVTGYGIAELQKYLTPGKTVVFLGSSGIGKSSLLNALMGEDVMEVKAIREDDGKGRHTTTRRQLITLPNGASIIDTPGMRELGMWDAAEGIGGVFADVEELLGGCRFSNCGHQSEPGCVILEAIESGELPRERWESYLKLKREALYADDKAAAIRAKNAWGKSISVWSRHQKKDRRKP